MAETVNRAVGRSFSSGCDEPHEPSMRTPVTGLPSGPTRAPETVLPGSRAMSQVTAVTSLGALISATVIRSSASPSFTISSPAPTSPSRRTRK